MSNTYTYDTHCYDLACMFLDDVKGATEAQRKDLASTIQQAIEDWLDGRNTLIEEARQCAYDDYIESKIDERRIEGRA